MAYPKKTLSRDFRVSPGQAAQIYRRSVSVVRIFTLSHALPCAYLPAVRLWTTSTDEGVLRSRRSSCAYLPAVVISRAHIYPQSRFTVRIFTTGQTPRLRRFTNGRPSPWESDNLTHADSFRRSGCADLPAVVRIFTTGQTPPCAYLPEVVPHRAQHNGSRTT